MRGPEEDEAPETISVETKPATPEPEESEEIPEDLVPADRLTLLNNIVYYGDPAQCRMTVNQARAFADVIERRIAEEMRTDEHPAESYAALVDIGEGKPILVLVAGLAESFQIMVTDYHKPAQCRIRLRRGRLSGQALRAQGAGSAGQGADAAVQRRL